MNALAPINRDEYETMHQTARTLALSGYFDAQGDTPKAIAQLATKILAGREIGFGPFASAQGIHIIQGRPAVGANLMASAVKGSGRYNYRVREMSASVCRIEYFERMGDKWESIGISEFTLDDARKAGTKNLDKFARNMLFARAMSNGVRWYCPDVFSGNAVYVPEELGADVDGDGNVIETTGHVVTESATATPVVSQPAAQTGRNGAQPATPGVEADVDMGMGDTDDNPFNAAWYVVAWESLPKTEATIVGKLIGKHRNSNGPASAKQYGYLAGLIDAIIKDATGATDGHKRVLPVVCQSDISRNNLPGADVVETLLKHLPTHVTDGTTGEKRPNPDYSKAVADAMVTIYRAAESVSTPRLIEA